MSTMLRYFSMLAVTGYFCLIIHLLKREKFLLRYGILWLMSGLIMLLIVIFPSLLFYFTEFLGIRVASNALFAICIFLVIMMLVFLTTVVTELTDRIKKMAQKTAIIEKRMQDLEEIKNGYVLVEMMNEGKDEIRMKPAIAEGEKKR